MSPDLLAQRASAARWPERAALSMVEGQPVAIQSPARKQFGHGEMRTAAGAVDAGGHAEGGAHFLDQRGFFELRFFDLPGRIRRVR